MSPHTTEWLHLLLRWFHIVAGVMWIGNSFFFMWLDRAFEPPRTPKDGVTGETFLIHGGGYYFVERRKLEPGKLPPTLHWFRWEATLTWISGFSLLLVVYYASGGALLMDRSLGLTRVQATLVGLGSLPAAWLLYDLIWLSPAGKRMAIAGPLSLALLGGLAWGLTQLLSARAAFMHVGAVLGTIMVLNVWLRILPQQARMLEAMEAGRSVDPRPGLQAKQRSTHNSYMTLGVIFVMLSNHFSIVGYQYNWLALLGLIAAGAGIRHFMLEPGKRTAMLVVLAAGVVIGLYFATMPRARARRGGPAVNLAAADARPIDPAEVGTVRGTVSYGGELVTPRELALPGDCTAGGSEPTLDNRVLVSGGMLQNALVYLSDGAERWLPPAAATTPVVIDQRGCMYHPRVLGLRTGQPLAIRNSDGVMHNVHGVAEANDGFNEAMVPGAAEVRYDFQTPEIVNLQCDVHPWMGARVGIFAHPWFAVTDARGAFELTGVPPGDYVIVAWHETLGTRKGRVTVTAQGSAEASFRLPE
ncbi:MAG: urate hydroxylase PuuD [Deltaproteobacteria bacterium]|nr:urate hydroxylase PuuD [Deltaproteobacteria bacterium]